MKNWLSGAIFLLAAINVLAQDPPSPRSPLDPANWGVVYDLPGTRSVKLRSEVKYSGDLAIDIYSPANAKDGTNLPAVVFLNAIGDRPDNKVKSWEIYKTWPRLIAATGMVGISMDADGTKIQDSLRSLFDFLSREGSKYGIDAERLGVYAASANVTQTSVFLMSENAPKGIKAAALYYGGAPPMRPRNDLPVLFIVAEGDMPQFGAALPALWQRILEAKAPWTLQIASRLPHAFDAFEDSDESRRVIQQTIAFWKSHLEPVPQPSWKPSQDRATVSALYWNEPGRALPLLSKYLEKNPNEFTALMQYARMLRLAQRNDEALAVYEKTRSINPNHPQIYEGIGQIRFQQRRYQEAATNLSASIERGFRTPLVYGQLAYSQLALGKNEEAIRSYEQAFSIGFPSGPNTTGVAYYNMACAYTRLKNHDKAFELLGKAIDDGYANRRNLEADDDLAPLRGDARYRALLARLPQAGN